MPYHLHHDPDKRAIVIDVYDYYDIPADITQSTLGCIDILNSVTQPYSVIYDYRKIEITLDLLMRATEHARNLETENMAEYPMFAQNILVSDNRLLQMSLRGFKVLGIASQINMVPSLEEAYQLSQQVVYQES